MGILIEDSKEDSSKGQSILKPLVQGEKGAIDAKSLKISFERLNQKNISGNSGESGDDVIDDDFLFEDKKEKKSSKNILLNNSSKFRKIEGEMSSISFESISELIKVELGDEEPDEESIESLQIFLAELQNISLRKGDLDQPRSMSEIIVNQQEVLKNAIVNSSMLSDANKSAVIDPLEDKHLLGK